MAIVPRPIEAWGVANDCQGIFPESISVYISDAETYLAGLSKESGCRLVKIKISVVDNRPDDYELYCGRYREREVRL